jgi:hypothetical protein
MECYNPIPKSTNKFRLLNEFAFKELKMFESTEWVYDRAEVSDFPNRSCYVQYTRVPGGIIRSVMMNSDSGRGGVSQLFIPIAENK